MRKLIIDDCADDWFDVGSELVVESTHFSLRPIFNQFQFIYNIEYSQISSTFFHYFFEQIWLVIFAPHSLTTALRFTFHYDPLQCIYKLWLSTNLQGMFIFKLKKENVFSLKIYSKLLIYLRDVYPENRYARLMYNKFCANFDCCNGALLFPKCQISSKSMSSFSLIYTFFLNALFRYFLFD